MSDLGDRLYLQAGYRRGDPAAERLAQAECALFAIAALLGWADPGEHPVPTTTRAALAVCLLAGAVGVDPLAVAGQAGLFPPPAVADGVAGDAVLAALARALAEHQAPARRDTLVYLLGRTLTTLRGAAAQRGQPEPLAQVQRLVGGGWQRAAGWPFAPPAPPVVVAPPRREAR